MAKFVKWSKISLLLKNMAWFGRGYISSSFSIYITKTGNWWNSKFLKLSDVSRGYICRFFVAFWHPIFKQESQSDRANELKPAAMAVTEYSGEVYVYSCRKTVINKMDKILYF